MRSTGSKKNLVSCLSLDAKRDAVEPDHAILSIARQCWLLTISRSTFYFKAKGESLDDIGLKSMIDEAFTEFPYFGSRKMARYLRRQTGVPLNRKRIQRLMREMGIMAIYAKPNTSQGAPGHKIYPYLLRGLKVTRANQVWSCDITYIRLTNGYAYLMAVIDWYSRKVLSWRLSNTMDTSFCVEALEDALSKGNPEIFNTDQGSQFTSIEFTGILQREGIAISMDGRGRALDNIFVERLWRSVKYEDVYPKGYTTMEETRGGLGEYFWRYNGKRPHQALGYKTPNEVHMMVA